MKKKLLNLNTSKGIILPLDVIGNIEEVEMDIDTINKKIIISWE